MSDRDHGFDEANASLYRAGATDGLPVVPPTEQRVEEMLLGTDLPRDHEFGKLGNRRGSLTVEKLATNAVMAGCSPIHMPVLVAGARALADPDSNSIQSSVSTGSWAYLWIVNGPVRDRIDVRSDTGAFGPGFRTNRAIGRALGLAYKNTARIQPGEKDMGVLGSPFKYSLVAGENEEASPWEPFHVSAGYDAEESTITLAGPNSFVQATPYDMSRKGILKGMIYNTPPYVAGIRGKALKKRVFYAIAPYNAEELARSGMDKADVKAYLHRNAQLPDYKFHPGIVASEDPERSGDLQVPQFDSPEFIELVVIGGSGRVNAAIGSTAGGPVTKRVQFPEAWDELIERYRVEREWGQVDDHYAAGR